MPQPIDYASPPTKRFTPRWQVVLVAVLAVVFAVALMSMRRAMSKPVSKGTSVAVPQRRTPVVLPADPYRLTIDGSSYPTSLPGGYGRPTITVGGFTTEDAKINVELGEPDSSPPVAREGRPAVSALARGADDLHDVDLSRSCQPSGGI